MTVTAVRAGIRMHEAKYLPRGDSLCMRTPNSRMVHMLRYALTGCSPASCGHL